MYAKLIKHEFRATSRIMLPLYGAVLIMAAMTQAVLVLQNVFTISSLWISIPAGLLFALSILGVVVMVFVGCIVTILRFYKNLLGDEGYLMFTLPVTPAQHITAKLTTGVTWTAISVLLAITTMFFLSSSLMGWDAFAADFSRQFSALGIQGWAVIGMIALFFLVALCMKYLMLYTSMSVGSLYGTNRLLSSVIAFVAISFILQVVLLIGVGALAIFAQVTGVLPAWMSSVEANPLLFAGVLFGGIGILLFVLCLVFFLATRHILTHKLNLA